MRRQTVEEARFLFSKVEAAADTAEREKEAAEQRAQESIKDAEQDGLEEFSQGTLQALYDIMPQVREVRKRIAEGHEPHPILAPTRHEQTAILDASVIAARAIGAPIAVSYNGVQVTATPESESTELQREYHDAWISAATSGLREAP